jgi:aspartate/glutamate racemase
LHDDVSRWPAGGAQRENAAHPAMRTTNTRPVVCIVHTSFVSVTQLTELFGELAPAAQVRHIVDDTLLPEVLANRGVTPRVRSRMCEYYKAAELAGADLIFNQCSSVGEVADLASTMVNVPVIKVDARMAEVACNTGPRIGVVATLETTLGPTCRLIESTAARLGVKVEITRGLVAGAFDRLIAGDRATHNQMVLDAIRDLSRRVDVIVCAQGSMMAIVPDLGPTPVPVLTSPRLGVQSAAEWLAQRG